MAFFRSRKFLSRFLCSKPSRGFESRTVAALEQGDDSVSVFGIDSLYPLLVAQRMLVLIAARTDDYDVLEGVLATESQRNHMVSLLVQQFGVAVGAVRSMTL